MKLIKVHSVLMKVSSWDQIIALRHSQRATENTFYRELMAYGIVVYTVTEESLRQSSSSPVCNKCSQHV